MSVRAYRRPFVQEFRRDLRLGCCGDSSIELQSEHHRTDHIYKIIYSHSAWLSSNARTLLKTLAHPEGFEPSTPGLEDRSSGLLKGVDLDGAVKLLVAAFAAASLKPVESRGCGVQPPATVLLQSRSNREGTPGIITAADWATLVPDHWRLSRGARLPNARRMTGQMVRGIVRAALLLMSFQMSLAAHALVTTIADRSGRMVGAAAICSAGASRPPHSRSARGFLAASASSA